MSVRRFGWLCLLAVVTAAPAPPQSDRYEIAITIDDVPWSGRARPQGPALVVATQRLLEALASHSAPAAALITCDNVRTDTTALRVWVDAGLELGNHSAAHLDLNRVPLADWLADIRRCDRYLRAFVGRPVPYFRFPQLHRGPTPERKEAAGALLAKLAYRTAPVSVDNSEWILAAAYADAVLARDAAAMGRIGEAYVAHVLEMIDHFRAVARRKVGRDVKHILLLHANALAVDHLDGLLHALSADGARFITLGEALRDPVYSVPDAYVGLKGLSWLYRIEPLSPDEVAWDDVRAADLRQRLGL